MHSVCANSAELSTMFGKMFDTGMEKSIPEWDALMGGVIGYMASLTSMMKCFQTSSACSMISEDKFIRDFPLETTEFYKYKEWRNKHFIHDENFMRQAIAFLFVSPEGAEETLGGLPSVIWNRVLINFLLEGRQLEILMQALWKFICGEIDKIGQSLLDEYKQKSREELLSFGTAQIKLSTVDSPEKTRN